MMASNEKALPLFEWVNQDNYVSRQDAKHAKKNMVFILKQ